MQIHNGELPRARQLARTGKELSREARVRLQWMDFYRRSQNVARACRHFGISRQTFYRWQHRYDPLNLATLEPRSHRPHRRRQPTWSAALADRVLALRQRYPRWGKDKLAVLLRQQHLSVSTSMVGRILTQMKRQGRLVEPPRSGVAGSRRPLHPRPYAIRKPKQYAVSRPGDLVQVDTLDVRPLPGVVFKQFTARDVLSRWDVIQPTPELPPPPRPSSSTPCSTACPFPSVLCKSTAARSSPLSSSRPASNGGCTCSSYRPALPSSTDRSNAPSALTPKSSIRSQPARWR